MVAPAVQTVPNWWEVEKTFDDLATDNTHQIKIKREIVPIILVPGIMGSRLNNASSGKAGWDPDSNWFMMTKFRPGKSGADRREVLVGDRFDPGFLTPMTALPSDAVKKIDAAHGSDPRVPTSADAATRGWGSVWWKGYGDLLLLLSTTRFAWIGVPYLPKDFSLIFDTPVYAFGYNWTDTNAHAGDALNLRIVQIKAAESANGPCDKVIVVTHSMGGLAARAASELSQAQGSIQGIVHGVQPAIGAAAAYWRMKAGFERASDSGYFDPANFLGPDGAKVTAVLGNIPGGLELAPHQSYTLRDGGWLRVWDPANTRAPRLRLPASDPFTEMYQMQDRFYRLVETKYLDPANFDRDNPATGRAAFGQFLAVLGIAHRFERRIAGLMHPYTYVFFGDGGTSTAAAVDITLQRHMTRATRKIPSRDIAVVAADPTLIKYGDFPGQPSMPAKNENQWVDFFQDSTAAIYRASLGRPNGPGDGTVPTNSGNGLDPSKINVGSTQPNALSLSHQGAYDDGAARAFAVEAISLLLLRRSCERLGVKLPF